MMSKPSGPFQVPAIINICLHHIYTAELDSILCWNIDHS